LSWAFDPGTAITGYGLVREEEEGLALVECGVITTPGRSAVAPAPADDLPWPDAIIASTNLPGAVEELFF